MTTSAQAPQPASWAALDSNDFPVGFMSADAYSFNEAQAEFPDSRIEYVTGDRRTALLAQHVRFAR